MKRLAGAPLLLSLLLTIPLWLVLDNIVVALVAALLLAFLTSMVYSLIILKSTASAQARHSAPADLDTPMPSVRSPHRTKSHDILPDTAIPTGLPQPDIAAQTHMQALRNYLAQQAQATPDGFLPFEQWMQHALYAPGLGYYAADARKFGADGGDFTTAPELTPLFGQALAAQVAQVLHESGSLHVLEFGAGSGALAASLIPALRALGIEPHYAILEVSPSLRERQQARLSPLQARVQWLDTLPSAFMGCVIANEVLDAMPATLWRWDEHGQLAELGVVDTALPGMASDTTVNADPRLGFALAERAASDALHTAVSARTPSMPGYRSELNLQAEAWVRQLGSWLHKGAALLIDYGFPQREYYHPQRAEGTLMCHFRHHAHGDALVYPGLQDITTHVDFTAMADAALDGGLEVLGYTSQARFLMNCGLVSLLAAPADSADPAAQAATLSAAQKLLSEAEMGELFKVLALGRGIDVPLVGFQQGDRRHGL